MYEKDSLYLGKYLTNVMLFFSASFKGKLFYDLYLTFTNSVSLSRILPDDELYK